MDFDIESWMPYKCDFRPIMTNTLFSDSLGRIAEMAMRAESEFLYMESGDTCPVGTLVPENLIRPRIPASGYPSFAMVFSYSHSMEELLFGLAEGNDSFGAGIAVCGIWKSRILMDECKVLVVASVSAAFDAEAFLGLLHDALAELTGKEAENGKNVPYFAEKFGYRRFQIPYETDDITDLRISSLLMSFEFDETLALVGPHPELSLDLML